MKNGKNSKDFYKIVPCFVEKRGNLRVVGVEEPVEYKVVKDLLIVHVKENMGSQNMDQLNGQLRMIFGEPLLLFAFKNDVSFFVAKPMTEKEVKNFETGKNLGNTS